MIIYRPIISTEVSKTKKQVKKEERIKAEYPTDEVEIPMETKTAMAEIATRCLCSLLNNLFHFNYTTNIITIIVKLMVNQNEGVRALFIYIFNVKTCICHASAYLDNKLDLLINTSIALIALR